MKAQISEQTSEQMLESFFPDMVFPESDSNKQ
jgi:hypothetical protein